jgi:hypothetical protein
MRRFLKIPWLYFAAIFFAFLPFRATATTYYVDINSLNPTPPYTSWSTASTDIQSAINIANNGDLILVNDGVYQTGGQVVYGSLTNRVVISLPVTVQSVNGPATTVIEGYQDTSTINGDDAVRCVFLSNGAVLSGFTLTNGATQIDPDESQDFTLYAGGGVFCDTTNVVVTNCVITGCSADDAGGGAEGRNTFIEAGGGMFFDCAFVSNQCIANAGADQCILSNCTLTGNSAGYGGGAGASTLINCTLANNSAFDGGQGAGGGAEFCILTGCTLETNSSDIGGGAWGNSDNPCTLSNCTLVANSSLSTGGGANGCTLYNCTLADNIANDGYFYTDSGGGAFGSTLFNCILTNNYSVSGGGAESSTLNNCTLGGNAALGNGGGADNSVLNQCCLVNNQVDVSGIGDSTDSRVFASNPLFILPDAGAGADNSALTNCTLIGNQAVGYAVGGGADSSTLENCLLATNTAGDNGGGANNCTLTDCILTSNNTGVSGGGAEGGTLFNCVLTGNSAANNGGGADGATLCKCFLTNNMVPEWNGGGVSGSSLKDCTLFGNMAGQAGGGAFNSALTNCLLASNTVANAGGAGGGAYGSEMDRCRLIGNIAIDSGGGTGGGACFCNVNNSLLTGNYADLSGGGAMYGTLNNCTVVSNSAAVSGGGAGDGNLNNCIVYDNTAPCMKNFVLDGEVPGLLNYCCIPDLPAGANGMGNITNDPAFVNFLAGDFHLQSGSPCINSGNNAYVQTTNDLDDNPRIVGGTVDIGAYEYQTPTSVISYAYLQQYGLPMNGSVDFADLDGTGFNVYQDWIAGLNPTNPASVLVMLPPSPTNNSSGITVTWKSVSGILYNLQRSSNLACQPPFSTIQSNIVGQAGTTTYVDTTATNNIPYFYRVGVP